MFGDVLKSQLKATQLYLFAAFDQNVQTTISWTKKLEDEAMMQVLLSRMNKRQ